MTTEHDTEPQASAYRSSLLPRVLKFGIAGIVVLALSNVCALWPARIIAAFGLGLGLFGIHHVGAAFAFVIVMTIILGFGAGAIVGLSWHLHFRQYDPRDPSECRYCGYNLTGVRTGRCPECGGTIPSTAGRRRPETPR
jgi:hypothetical protein